VEIALPCYPATLGVSHSIMRVGALVGAVAAVSALRLRPLFFVLNGLPESGT
jgi:hypothetical protein